MAGASDDARQLPQAGPRRLRCAIRHADDELTRSAAASTGSHADVPLAPPKSQLQAPAAVAPPSLAPPTHTAQGKTPAAPRSPVPPRSPVQSIHSIVPPSLTHGSAPRPSRHRGSAVVAEWSRLTERRRQQRLQRPRARARASPCRPAAASDGCLVAWLWLMTHNHPTRPAMVSMCVHVLGVRTEKVAGHGPDRGLRCRVGSTAQHVRGAQWTWR